MKISAVIPVHNGQEFIKETFDSLVDQRMPLHEIIVINDGSTDETRTIVQEYVASGKVTLLDNERKLGVSFSRNRGIAEAGGDWILLMDSDDVANRNLTIQHVRSWSEKQSDGEWVLSFSSYQQINKEGQPLGGVSSFKQVKPYEILGYEFVRNHVCVSGTMISKSRLMEAGMFDERLTHSEDWDLWLRLAAIGGFIYIDEPLFYVRRHNNNASKTVESMLEGERKVLLKYTAKQIEKAIFQRELPNERNVIDLVSVLYRVGHWDKGRAALKTLIQQKNGSASAYLFLGLYHIAKAEYESALQILMQAYRLDPDRAEVLNNIGALYILNGELSTARFYIKKAMTLLPGYLDATHNLSAIEKRNFSSVKFTWRELRSVLTVY